MDFMILFTIFTYCIREWKHSSILSKTRYVRLLFRTLILFIRRIISAKRGRCAPKKKKNQRKQTDKRTIGQMKEYLSIYLWKGCSVILTILVFFFLRLLHPRLFYRRNLIWQSEIRDPSGTHPVAELTWYAAEIRLKGIQTGAPRCHSKSFFPLLHFHVSLINCELAARRQNGADSQIRHLVDSGAKKTLRVSINAERSRHFV